MGWMGRSSILMLNVPIRPVPLRPWDPRYLEWGKNGCLPMKDYGVSMTLFNCYSKNFLVPVAISLCWLPDPQALEAT